MSNEKCYTVFTRTFWKHNPNYPGGKEPSLGRKTILESNLTYEEAVRVCKQYNETHKPGKLSRKAELAIL